LQFSQLCAISIFLNLFNNWCKNSDFAAKTSNFAVSFTIK